MWSLINLVFSSPAKVDVDHEDIAREEDVQKSRASSSSWVSWGLSKLLSQGEVPSHIAFILDGNRRFAVKNNLEKTEGHYWGFDKLHEALEWCWDAGVDCVTVYAFSIENFKRPKDEVDTLMNLARSKFEYLLSKSDMIKRNRVVVHVWGDISLLPKDVRDLVDRLVKQTSGHDGPTLNVCFPYTSTHEIVSTTKGLAQQVQAGGLDYVSVDSFEKKMFSEGNHPDVLIRTSGETRLSDFLCWQTGESHFLVYQCLWPEFTAWHFTDMVLRWRSSRSSF